MADTPSPMEQRLSSIAVSGFLAGAITIGYKLNLFQALNDVSSEENPATPEQVAKVAGCKPRYVKEWLAFMTTNDIVEVTKDEKFWIKPENLEALTGKGFGLLHNKAVVDMLSVSDQLIDCIKKDGPYGLEYAQYDGICDSIGEHSEALHKKHLISGLLPMISGDMIKKLEDGGMMVLDVGCGNGFHISHLAEHFPNSNFTGVDTFENLAFIEMNAAKMDGDWTDKYDLILIFDACHDQTRPDLCLKEIQRILKPGGYFAMLETAGDSNIFLNKQKFGFLASMLYSFSLFHCLPVASNAPDAIGAGTMWGRQMATRMLQEAGFSSVEVKDTPQFLVNQLYVCKK